MTPAQLARAAAQQREAQNAMIADTAVSMQAQAGRARPEVFGDEDKVTVIAHGRAVPLADLVRIGPGPHRPAAHAES